MKETFFYKKNINSLKSSISKSVLSKTIGTLDIALIGIGSIVGGGVFIFTGIVASKYSGPGIIVSYFIAGLISFCSALLYIELASMMPSPGIGYSYSYVAFGEIIAWVVFFLVFLEFSTAASAATLGCSKYFISFLESLGADLGIIFSFIPFRITTEILISSFIVFFLTAVLCIGTNFSKKITFILVVIKLTAILLFCFVLRKHFDTKYWVDFFPFGSKGIITGSAILYFSFNGYSLLASTAEECKNPKRNLSLGTLFAILTAIILYSLVGAILTGCMSYKELNVPNSLSFVLSIYSYNFFSAIVSFGAMFGILSVILFNIFALSRILYTVAKDQLIPKFFSKINKRQSPYIAIFFSSFFVLLLICSIDIETLGRLSGITGLIDSLLILIIVIKLRFFLPDEKRIFKVPFLKVVAPITFCSITFLLVNEFYDCQERVFTYYFKMIFILILISIFIYFARFHFKKLSIK